MWLGSKPKQEQSSGGRPAKKTHSLVKKKHRKNRKYKKKKTQPRQRITQSRRPSLSSFSHATSLVLDDGCGDLTHTSCLI
jgi:hypothetical protein